MVVGLRMLGNKHNFDHLEHAIIDLNPQKWMCDGQHNEEMKRREPNTHASRYAWTRVG